MEVLLMRHSRTAGNIARRYIGTTDEPLCDEGMTLAHSSGVSTDTAHVFVSPLKRALETAKIKFPNAELTIVDGLREMDFGVFEGRAAAELEHDAAYIKWLESNCTLPCPDGEGMSGFADRVCRAFDTIVRASIPSNGRRLIIVAHGGSIMSILSRYGKPERQYYEWYVDNCCGYRATLDEKSWDDSPALLCCEFFSTLP
jgi:alpha-ribazole phosphatase